MKAKAHKTIEELLLENPDFANEKDKLKISNAVVQRMATNDSDKLKRIYEAAKL
jgi:hypothetical protein